MEKINRILGFLFFEAATECVFFCLFALLFRELYLTKGLDNPWNCFLMSFLLVRCLKLCLNFCDPAFYRMIREKAIGFWFCLFSLTAISGICFLLCRDLSSISRAVAH